MFGELALIVDSLTKFYFGKDMNIIHVRSATESIRFFPTTSQRRTKNERRLRRKGLPRYKIYSR
jgi:hypothetical protein